MSNQVVLLENKGKIFLLFFTIVGNEISYEDFDLLVNSVNDSMIYYGYLIG